MIYDLLYENLIFVSKILIFSTKMSHILYEKSE